VRYAANLGIHFYTENDVAITLDATSDAVDERTFEVLLFALYALRQLVNLGPSWPDGSLADFLMELPGCLVGIASDTSDDIPQLVEYKGSPAPRRFMSRLQYDDTICRFNMNPRGFGFLARGVGYYAPTSVAQLLIYLALRRGCDPRYVAALETAARLSGEALRTRQVNMRNQVPTALSIASRATQQDVDGSLGLA
jgi:hypothetical protein